MILAQKFHLALTEPGAHLILYLNINTQFSKTEP